jgi:hypothetical protein
MRYYAFRLYTRKHDQYYTTVTVPAKTKREAYRAVRGYWPASAGRIESVYEH